MRNKGLLICDFSGVYEEEGFIKALRGDGIPFEVLDFKGVEGAQCYCDGEAEKKIRALTDGSKEVVRWIDSGDYHYMSLLFAESIEDPFTLVLLDNHPDDQAPGFGEILSCGGWVRELFKNSKALEGLLAVGPEGELKGPEDFKKAFAQVAPRRVYISLDKDVMGRDYARTDWSQGNLSLDEVKEIIREVLGSGAEILGIDICGELTESKGAKAEDYEINLKTNIELQKLISDYLNHCYV